MHPTNRSTHSPTPRQQIKRLLTLLALAVGCAVASVGLMLYTAPAERTYALTDILIAPENLPRIAWQEPSSSTSPSNSSVWRFDSIILSFVDPISQQLTTRTLTPTDYARLYAQLASDSSLNETERLLIEKHGSPLTKESSIELSIWLKTDSPPLQRRLLQTVLFLPSIDLYRVQLHKLDHTLEPAWATYHHNGLTPLLHSLTQDTL